MYMHINMSDMTLLKCSAQRIYRLKKGIKNLHVNQKCAACEMFHLDLFKMIDHR